MRSLTRTIALTPIQERTESVDGIENIGIEFGLFVIEKPPKLAESAVSMKKADSQDVGAVTKNEKIDAPPLDGETVGVPEPVASYVGTKSMASAMLGNVVA